MTSFERQLDHDLAHMFDDVTHHFSREQQGACHRSPNYTFDANEEQAYLEVELPGVAKGDVTLNLRGDELVITADRFRAGYLVKGAVDDELKTETLQKENESDMTDKAKTDEPKPSVVYKLKLRIGKNYDAENIQASMEGDGILKVVIPMKLTKKDTPRMIQIQ